MSIRATAPDPERAAETARAVLRAIEQCLRDLQSGRGVDPAVRVAVVESFRAPAVAVLPVHPLLGVIGLAVLAGMTAAGTRALVLRRG